MPVPSLVRPHRAALALAAAVALGPAQAMLTVSFGSPDWEIALSDYGYSDYLGDLTPTFQGREYLSGEWAGAVGYQRGNSGGTRGPIWLEPDFIFPDWKTNSNFQVVSPMALGEANAQGLPTASSVIANNDLQITQHLQIVDTRTGIAMGNAPAAVGGGGVSLMSNRYVLLQSYTFHNVSDTALDGLQFFQLLHGLTSQSGVHDNRAYGAGAMADYRYDVTLGGDAGGGAGQFDYIALHSKVAPSAVEIGAYGLFGIDDHGIGKPSAGTHLSVEANALNGATAFDGTGTAWVAGAQRYELGPLAVGQSVTFDLALSILTGYQVGGGGGGSSGSAGGGSTQTGGVDFQFQDSVDPGKFFFAYEAEDAQSIAELIAAGEIGPLTFTAPGERLPLWELEYDASFAGQVKLTFGLTGVLPEGLDPERLHVYHWTGDTWADLGGNWDPASNTITVFTDTLSPFALGVPVPEPATAALWLVGLGWLGRRLRHGGLHFPPCRPCRKRSAPPSGKWAT